MRKRNKVQRLLAIMIGAAMLAGAIHSRYHRTLQQRKTAQYRHRKVHRHREPMKNLKAVNR